MNTTTGYCGACGASYDLLGGHICFPTVATSGTGKRTLAITCSSCGQDWTSDHQCPVPPEIDTARYTDEALQRLADHLTLVLEDRRKVRT